MTAQPTEDGEAYILNGEKLWCTNGPVADIMVVMASTPPRREGGRRGITAFIIERDMPGVEVTHRSTFMGLRGIENGVIRFTDVRVPSENILWGVGQGLRSEEHTSELQSRGHLVCRLLLEKKKPIVR